MTYETLNESGFTFLLLIGSNITDIQLVLEYECQCTAYSVCTSIITFDHYL